MPATCFTPIGGNTMRVIKLDSCGTVLTSTGSCKVISSGFVRVSRSPEYEDPDEFIVKNANGDICVNERTNPVLKWLNVEIEFCSVDPDIFNLITGNPVVLNDAATPVSIGWRTRENVVSAVSFSLEVWTRLSGSTACSGGTVNYGYSLWPWVVQGTLGDYAYENGPISFTVSARTKAGALWGTGPFNIRKSAVSPFTSSKLLTAISSTDHEHFEITSLAPPATACGCATVTADP